MNKISMILLFICFILAGCNADTINTPRYEGKSLIIGVIGDAPNIREKTVNFKKITFNQLEVPNLSADFDAIFIMKEHLSEAARQQYAKIYKNAGIPFFFIESKKSYLPFINEEMSYEDVPDLTSDNYATGYFQSGKEYRHWGYGLYNDKANERNIEDVYTRIFTTIETFEVAVK
ncbi:hypothetical protein BVG16_12310 [Paenibacillus selenitireducens]|uniref:Transcription elongation factor GreAB n=1 Tax=Paenibacillus selenitireducens TaxID=1324314 RepID=A0A1T2XFI0_9BACL|nr:hypothetical protein [Paenibacillus selenitireducens]OPA78639.1 hypothetical protein BVG16_12310 [Paenibacillus selenitireducens]